MPKNTLGRNSDEVTLAGGFLTPNISKTIAYINQDALTDKNNCHFKCRNRIEELFKITCSHVMTKKNISHNMGTTLFETERVKPFYVSIRFRPAP